MKLSDFIRELQRMQAMMSPDATVILFDKTEEREFHANPEDEVWGFDIMRGDNQVVIEF